MSNDEFDPDDGTEEDYSNLAGWDNGDYQVTHNGDHTTVWGSIDGSHYHISWGGDGPNSVLHSTFDKGDDQWHVTHNEDGDNDIVE